MMNEMSLNRRPFWPSPPGLILLKIFVSYYLQLSKPNLINLLTVTVSIIQFPNRWVNYIATKSWQGNCCYSDRMFPLEEVCRSTKSYFSNTGKLKNFLNWFGISDPFRGFIFKSVGMNQKLFFEWNRKICNSVQ